MIAMRAKALIAECSQSMENAKGKDEQVVLSVAMADILRACDSGSNFLPNLEEFVRQARLKLSDSMLDFSARDEKPSMKN